MIWRLGEDEDAGSSGRLRRLVLMLVISTLSTVVFAGCSRSITTGAAVHPAMSCSSSHSISRLDGLVLRLVSRHDVPGSGSNENPDVQVMASGRLVYQRSLERAAGSPVNLATLNGVSAKGPLCIVRPGSTSKPVALVGYTEVCANGCSRALEVYWSAAKSRYRARLVSFELGSFKIIRIGSEFYLAGQDGRFICRGIAPCVFGRAPIVFRPLVPGQSLPASTMLQSRIRLQASQFRSRLAVLRVRSSVQARQLRDGIVLAWAADECRLGEPSRALAGLQRTVHGWILGDAVTDLKRWGYCARSFSS